MIFSAPKLVIDRLGVPVPAPVTVGSTPAPDTMASDSPDVVSVLPDGSLVAHRDGRATIRPQSASGQSLEVQVRTVGALAVVPARVTVRPRGETQLRLVKRGSGEEIPADAARWASDAPGVAIVIAGRIEATDRPGSANILAYYGGTEARAQVIVGVVRGPAFRLRPDAPRLRVGQSVTFEAVTTAGTLPARWEARRPEVLGQSGPRTFDALAAGRSDVCAESSGRAVCTTVVVRR